ncbi:hypothetical protein [Hoyosella subflava]|uniref:Uncharacterized protein n=1 Tax=Hoyosella subflava (strain DSM 45089 / JCM 17490 / NBRC 109087 / DQS3-9A1) TaxID=443218 RepID=F6EGD1_HOYSD|nr:hypothetical protein [Hoyosella subflava]AEF39856.1 hypothetical protein AS9A_1404 [Hoyosella subflava DQS3-9A1]
MRKKGTKKGLLAAACALPLALGVAACGDDDVTTDDGLNGDQLGETWDDAQEEVEGIWTTGGDTSCSDFIEQDEDEQLETVTAYLEDDLDRSVEPNDPEVNETTTRLLEVCVDPAEADTAIRDADTGGM